MNSASKIMAFGMHVSELLVPIRLHTYYYKPNPVDANACWVFDSNCFRHFFAVVCFVVLLMHIDYLPMIFFVEQWFPIIFCCSYWMLLFYVQFWRFHSHRSGVLLLLWIENIHSLIVFAYWSRWLITIVRHSLDVM